MEGITQKDDAAEVIVIDDSFEGDIFETPTCTGKTPEAESGESAELETASGITQKSLPKNSTTESVQVETVSFKGHVIHVHADLPVSPVEACSGRDTASECFHLEGVPDADRVEDQQLDNPGLATERCQSAIGESSNAGCTSIDACSGFLNAGSNAGKEETDTGAGKEETDAGMEETHTDAGKKKTHTDAWKEERYTNAGKEKTHTDAGKEETHPSAVETSLQIEPVSISLDSKSIDESSNGMPVKCSMDNESSDVQNDRLVIPISSKELSSGEIPPEVTGRQLKPAGTDTVSHTSDKELAQSTHPRYIIIQNKNTATKLDTARKPGDKLTSLLQRLTSGRGGKVAVTLSTMTKSLSVQDTKTQAEVNQSSLAGSSTMSVQSPAMSVVSPTVFVQSAFLGSPAVSVQSPAVSVVSTVVPVGLPAVSVGLPAVSVVSPAVSVVSPAMSVVSPAVPVRSLQDKPAVSLHIVKATPPRTSRKITVKFPSVPQESFPISKLPLQTDSSTKTDQSQESFKTKAPKPVSFEKVTIPATMSSGKDPVQSFPQVQYGKQAKKSQSVRASLMATQPAKAPLKLDRKVFKVFATNSTQSPNSAATPGFPALIPADKIKYVLGYLPAQGSRTSNIIFTGPEGQNIIFGKTGETYLQPTGVQNSTQKSKYSFSLLQNTASKQPEAAQVNDSPQGRVMKRSATVRSLLTSSSPTVPILKSPKISASEPANANASNSLPNVTGTMPLQDMLTPSTFSGTQKNKRAQTNTRQYQLVDSGQTNTRQYQLVDSGQTNTRQYQLVDSGQTNTRQYQLAESAQITLQALPQQHAVTTSGDLLSSGVSTVALSKLASTTSTSRVPINKACTVPSSASSLTATGRQVFMMPTSLFSTTVPTTLTPSSIVSSKSLLAPGIMTTANPNQSNVLKTVFLPKTYEANPAIQPPANTAHSFSDLITRFALQSVPSTSVNKPSENVKSSIQALNLALLQLKQDLGDSAAPLRIIVSQTSGFKPAAKLVHTQSQPSAVSQCSTITTQAEKKITVSKTSPRSITVTDVSSKQIPQLIYPKPVSTDGVKGASGKAKGVSLLPMSLVAKNQTTPESRGGAVAADVARNSHPLTKYKLINVKPRDEQIVAVSGLKEAVTNNPAQKSKKVKISTRAGAPKKSKNVVYTAILRTGQGPVSVKVVAPDMDDDSSDTMSDAGWSNVMFSEDSGLAGDDTRGQAADVDSSPSNKLFESDMPDLLCTEEVIHSYQEAHDSCDDVVLNTESQDMGSSIEPVVSHYVHEVSDEETDTDTEATSMEEQDMSVLRQLLTNTATNSLCDSETAKKFHNFSDLMVLSNAGNQPGNALSSDPEGLTLLTSNSENDISVSQVVTEDVESCDLKIESVFSLRDPGGCLDTELPADIEACQELPDDQTEPLPAFNVRTSDDWKSFLNPCYVVLERLSKSELLVGGSTKTASKCSGHCRKRTLDYLCNLKLLRCVNHPDPFLFSKHKPRKMSVKKTMKKMIKHGVIKEMCVPEGVSNTSQRVQGAAREAAVKTVDLTKVISKCSPVVKTTYVKEDIATGKSPSLMKKIFVKKDFGKSPSLVKEIYVNKDGQTLSLVNETYIKEDVGTSPSLVKEIFVKKDVSKSPSLMREINVKKDGRSPSMLKAARARKTMRKPAPLVKFTFVKEPLSKLSPMTRETCVKASVRELPVKDVCVKATVSEPQMKVACVKETVSELQMKEAYVKEKEGRSSPAAKELCGEDDMNDFSPKLQEAYVQNATTKPSPVVKETCINEDVVNSLPDCSLSLPSLNQQLSHKPLDKSLISDPVQLSGASSSDQTEHTSTAQDDQKANDKTTDLDSIFPGPKPLKFNRALKQLQRQVNKKRVTMLTDKLSRKKVRKPQTKQNERKCKIKLARQKHTNKVAVKRLTRKILKRNVKLTTGKINILAKSKSGYKRARGDAAEGLLINPLPSLDHDITQDSSPKNILPQNKDACSTDTPGAKPVSDTRITQLSNVQHKNIKPNLVRLQPKMPAIPQEKIQSALHSLNSYLAATGRKPTTGNTQLILLKIDDQHVLVKWPARPATTTPESSSNIDTKKPKQNEAVSATAADSSDTPCNPINSLASTRSVGTITADGNGTLTVTNPTSNNTTLITNIVNPNSEPSVLAPGNSESAVGVGKKGLRIMRTKQVVKKTPSSGKSSLYSAPVPESSTCTQQPVSNVIINTSATGTSNITYGTLKTVGNVIINTSATGIPNITNSTLQMGPSVNKQTFLSLLKSGALTQSTSRALTAFVNSVRATSPIVTSVVSSPVISDSFGKAGSSDIDSSKKTSSKDTNVTLSRLPPNSLMLPGRKRPNSVLSEEERRAKRRRLEEKYPLPPGIVIKSEPDDLQDYLTSVSPGISSRSDSSPAFTTNSSLIPTGHTESPEPFIMSSDDQVWSVEDSVNIGSYFTDTGHPVQESTRDPAVHGIPTNSTVEYNLSSESCLNTEDSYDEQDEPPALLDETIEDVAEDFHLEDIPDSPEDIPPVLQPMFTSSCISLVHDTDVEELESTEFIPEMSPDFTTFVPYNRQAVGARETSTSTDSISTTSLFSESSMDSGVDTNFPSTSFSHTSLHGPVVDRPVSKNMKIQYLKDLLKKKEMEIENMKRVQSELSPSDFDI